MKKVFSLIIAIVILSVLCTAAYANSGPKNWHGSDATGTILYDENCPIEVESELLTFDINELPKNYYKNQEEFQSYSSSLTAEYIFKNPTDQDITATLLFPFGTNPLYFLEKNDVSTGIDFDKYDVTVNDEVISRKIRHSYSPDNNSFNYDENIKLLHDTFMTDTFYAPSTPVTLYKFKFSEAAGDEKRYSVRCNLDIDTTKTKIAYDSWGNCNILKDNKIQVDFYIYNNTYFSLYVIGEDLSSAPQWHIYDEYNSQAELAGKVELVSSKAFSFEDLAFLYYKDAYGVTKSDWYNATLYEILSNKEFGYGVYTLDVSHRLMRWYEYDISIPPHKTINNTVTTPIYPSISGYYDPAIYEYTYLLSPAKKWNSFKNLDIVINTPYYITKCNLGKLKETDDGYKISLNSLPDSEFKFTLCESNTPEKVFNPYEIVKTIILAAIVLFPILLIALNIGIIISVVSNKKKRKS